MARRCVYPRARARARARTRRCSRRCCRSCPTGVYAKGLPAKHGVPNSGSTRVKLSCFTYATNVWRGVVRLSPEARLRRLGQPAADRDKGGSSLGRAASSHSQSHSQQVSAVLGHMTAQSSVDDPGFSCLSVIILQEHLSPFLCSRSSAAAGDGFDCVRGLEPAGKGDGALPARGRSVQCETCGFDVLRALSHSLLLVLVCLSLCRSETRGRPLLSAGGSRCLALGLCVHTCTFPHRHTCTITHTYTRTHPARCEAAAPQRVRAVVFPHGVQARAPQAGRPGERGGEQ